MFDTKVVERFWSKVCISKDGCWEWLGCKRSGYGAMRVGEKSLAAHRFSWMLHNQQEVPEGKIVCHKCNNPSCVRPSHLYVGTHSDNLRDAHKAGTQDPKRLVNWRKENTISPVVGSDSPNAKLTEEQAREIKVQYYMGANTRELGRIYGVDHAVVVGIGKGIRWKHI